MQKSALQAQKTFKTHPWLRIDVQPRKVEARCVDCGKWFEINYFHDCGRFLSGGKHRCTDCYHKLIGTWAGKAKHEQFMERVRELAQSHPERYLMDGEQLMCLCVECGEYYHVDYNNFGYHLNQEKHVCHECYTKSKAKRM